MFPNVSSVFFNWTSSVQMKIINKTAADFEVFEDTIEVLTFEAVVQPMASRDVNRKPEGERIWRWWTMWSTVDFEIDTIVQDPDGVQFRIQNTTNWQQGGFFIAEMTEVPVDA